MKKMIISLVVAMAVTPGFAQSSILATLSHGDETTIFYGGSALREAHAAAVNGDVITLSSGTFSSVNISKGITIRGAGMEVNTTTQSEPTIISGYFTINIPEEATEGLIIEGIYHDNSIAVENAANAQFIKDRLYEVTTYNSNNHLMFTHCRISNELFVRNNNFATCVNCIIWNDAASTEGNYNWECINCVIEYWQGGWNRLINSSLRNCILISPWEHEIDSSCTVYSCVNISDEVVNSIFGKIPNTTNVSMLREESNLFKTYDGNYKETENFELTEEAKTKYLGQDGTQVGIYGGSLPYDPTPSNPQITKCNVAAKSTADGKLSVDIEVNIAK
ncbi:MAG: hypothetical protein IJ635_06350 [Bacteroidaceae bacterium]|nr:hypothetical protein [Bacteroidaceae bacterium]